jgi:hypothetical protein
MPEPSKRPDMTARDYRRAMQDLWLPIPFDQMNETDVREDVLSPLIGTLGYRKGTENNVRRELELRYPKSYLGRKAGKRDPELRGRADYVLEVQGRVRWVLEAKAPDVDILAPDHREQARSYAAHPEVGAVYHVLSNGRLLAVFDTSESPETAPILAVAYEDMNGRLGEIASLLALESLMRAFPNRRLPSSPPLGPGLGAIAQILGGSLEYTKTSIPNSHLLQMRSIFSQGSVQRNAAGGMVAHVRNEASSRPMQFFLEQMKQTDFELVCDDSHLSIDPQRCNVFRYEHHAVIPANTSIPDLSSLKPVVVPQDLHVDILATATGFLSSQIFQGAWRTNISMMGQRHFADGHFVIRLS